MTVEACSSTSSLLSDCSSSEASSESTLEEYDVFQTTHKDMDFFLLQYQTSPQTSLDRLPREAYLKPVQEQIELSYDTNVEAECYEAVDESTSGLQRYLTLRSKKLVHQSDISPTFAVAAIDSKLKEIELLPLNNLLALNPCFDHLSIKTEEDAIEQKETEKGPKPVEVYQLRNETIEVAEYRKRSFKHLIKQKGKEKYVKAIVQDSRNNFKDLILLKS